jgi:uncharacterized protein YkwD
MSRPTRVAKGTPVACRTVRPHRFVMLALCVLGVLTACGEQTNPTGIWADRGASASGSPGYPGASPSVDPSAGSSGVPSATPGRTPTPAPTTGAPKSGYDAAAQAILDQTNAWRRAAGLRPYTMLSGLVASAHKHNLLMAASCGLSHECSGEPGLGDRISAQGVRWRAIGENIGWQGPVSNNVAAITDSAKRSNTSMYNEKPPNDGHRRNLLSSTFTHMGVDVIRDSKGKVWLTEDFST